MKFYSKSYRKNDKTIYNNNKKMIIEDRPLSTTA